MGAGYRPMGLATWLATDLPTGVLVILAVGLKVPCFAY